MRIHGDLTETQEQETTQHILVPHEKQSWEP